MHMCMYQVCSRHSKYNSRIGTTCTCACTRYAPGIVRITVGLGLPFGHAFGHGKRMHLHTRMHLHMHMHMHMHQVLAQSDGVTLPKEALSVVRHHARGDD